MSHEQDDVAGSYALMSEPELFRFATSYGSLTEFAQAALRAEFTGRALEPPSVDPQDDLVASSGSS